MVRREFLEEGIQNMKAQRHEKATHRWEPLLSTWGENRG